MAVDPSKLPGPGKRGSVTIFGKRVSTDAILIAAGGLVAAILLYRAGRPSGGNAATGFGQSMMPATAVPGFDGPVGPPGGAGTPTGGTLGPGPELPPPGAGLVAPNPNRTYAGGPTPLPATVGPKTPALGRPGFHA